LALRVAFREAFPLFNHMPKEVLSPRVNGNLAAQLNLPQTTLSTVRNHSNRAQNPRRFAGKED
jgi:hypothetical protein